MSGFVSNPRNLRRGTLLKEFEDLGVLDKLLVCFYIKKIKIKRIFKIQKEYKAHWLL